MKKAFIFLFASSLLFACNSKSNSNSNIGSKVSSLEVSTDSVSEISYTEAKGYFVHNTYKDSGVKQIKTKEEFDSIFSFAAVMGQLPTEIDFTTNYVIAIIGEESNKSPEIKIDSFTINGNENLLEYSIQEVGETSHTVKPLVLLVVDSKFNKDFKVNKL